MSAQIPARLVLTEWLSDHPAEFMLRTWELTEAQRRRAVNLLKSEFGEPGMEYLIPLSAISAMGEAGLAHGVVIWGT